jgi:hypothetical protein
MKKLALIIGCFTIASAFAAQPQTGTAATSDAAKGIWGTCKGYVCDSCTWLNDHTDSVLTWVDNKTWNVATTYKKLSFLAAMAATAGVAGYIGYKYGQRKRDEQKAAVNTYEVTA